MASGRGSVASSRGSYREESQMSRTGQDSEYEGFEDYTEGEILSEIALHVCQELSAGGQGSPMAEKIIMDNLNLVVMKFVSKMAQRGNQIKDMGKQVKGIKPESNGGTFIAVGEWWKAINTVGDSFGWSFALRCLFLKQTGGLARGVHDGHRHRVMEFMEDMAWMPEYKEGHRETDSRHWLYVWVNVGIRMILEFHQAQPAEMIEAGLLKMMNGAAYRLDPRSDDPLNSQIHKIDALYKAGNIFLKRRSTDLIASPIYWWSILFKWLKEQKPAGP